MSQRIIDLRKKNIQQPVVSPPRVIPRRPRVKKISDPAIVITSAQSLLPTPAIPYTTEAPNIPVTALDTAQYTPQIVKATQPSVVFSAVSAASAERQAEDLESAPITSSAAPAMPIASATIEPSKELPSAPALLEIENIPHAELQWTSYEHEYRQRGPYWFVYPLAIATIAMVFGIITHNYLFVLLVAISFALLIYYANHIPRLLTYRIEKRGVWIEKKLIDFSQIKSFWIYAHPLMTPELLLETHRPLNPILHIRLENISSDRIRSVIKQSVPEVEQKDRISDQIARMIGF